MIPVIMTVRKNVLNSSLLLSNLIVQCFLDRYGQANSVDPDQTPPLGAVLSEEQSDQGLHCLPFHLHLLKAYFFIARPICLKFTVFEY